MVGRAGKQHFEELAVGRIFGVDCVEHLDVNQLLLVSLERFGVLPAHTAEQLFGARDPELAPDELLVELLLLFGGYARVRFHRLRECHEARLGLR